MHTTYELFCLHQCTYYQGPRTWLVRYPIWCEMVRLLVYVILNDARDQKVIWFFHLIYVNFTLTEMNSGGLALIIQQIWRRHVSAQPNRARRRVWFIQWICCFETVGRNNTAHAAKRSVLYYAEPFTTNTGFNRPIATLVGHACTPGLVRTPNSRREKLLDFDFTEIITTQGKLEWTTKFELKQPPKHTPSRASLATRDHCFRIEHAPSRRQRRTCLPKYSVICSSVTGSGRFPTYKYLVSRTILSVVVDGDRT